MPIKEKLEKFMRARKRSEDTATLAAYFMVDTTTVNRSMRELEHEGKITRTKGSKGKNIWTWNNRVAVPDKPVVKQQAKPTQVNFGTPFKAQTSYPNVRGYDD